MVYRLQFVSGPFLRPWVPAESEKNCPKKESTLRSRPDSSDRKTLSDKLLAQENFIEAEGYSSTDQIKRPGTQPTG